MVDENSASKDDVDSPLRWLISCDESGTGGANYYGFGTLWMREQRRGEFYGEITRLRHRHKYFHEFKWQKTNSKLYQQFFIDLVDLFFQKNWLAFHSIIIRKALVKKEFHGGDYDLARRKHFTELLVNKIKRCIKAHPGRAYTFRIWVDPIASRYKKADEAVAVISNNVLAPAVGILRPVDKVITRDSKDTPSIQLCDLLLGAIMEAWQQKATSESKQILQGYIARQLGWSDLRADTKPEERKFNIWYFYDKEQGPREIETRAVNLKVPLPRIKIQSHKKRYHSVTISVT